PRRVHRVQRFGTQALRQVEEDQHAIAQEFRAGWPPEVADRDHRRGLLAAFRVVPLLDAYDVYQHLMDYWAEPMQDDCYLVADDGWREAAQPRLIVEEKSKKTKTKPDLVLGKKKYQAELIPPALIIRRWFADEQAAIDKLKADLAALEQQMEEMA